MTCILSGGRTQSLEAIISRIPIREKLGMQPTIPIGERQTPRLLLTPIAATDFDDLVRMYSNPQVMATLGGVRTSEQARQNLAAMLAHWQEHGFGWWAVRDRVSGQFAGRGGLRHAMVEGRPEVEVGYGLLPEFWGRGLATELALESVRVGFEELKFPELVSFTLPTNAPSKRVMEKVGFRYERDIIHAGLPHVLFRQLGPERCILESLDFLLRSESVRAAIEPIVQRVQQSLARDRSTTMAWEPIPLGIYGINLPSFIRSSWVFILRAGATTGAERHPNSHQRMMSYRGQGDFQTGGDGYWQSNLLVSDPDAELQRRWISIPVKVWHQAVVPADDWVVVSFHTVPADELIEERHEFGESGSLRQQHYVNPHSDSN
jgi:RimJ/RimL family protein N-acetyltransferase